MSVNKKFEKRNLTKKSENLSQWYNEIVYAADLAGRSEVKGAMIIKANGYALWEKVHDILDLKFKEDGVKNYYFPLLIPYHLLKKEKQHLEGFSPELAVVTHAGGEKLTEPYVLRPTSETIMYQTFADWIQSYRDLPFKINQWCNVVRWEKRSYPFLRTTEFLWQEGHTVHEKEEEAIEMTLKALKWYQDFYENYFAISPYVGIKSEREKFAGAKTTYSIEIVIPNGKSLQAATSHNLSDNFSKVFNISFLNDKKEKCYPYQTSWGLSTRSLGGLILVHGDDSGLIIPPQVADPQIVILPISHKDKKEEVKINKKAKEVFEKLRKKGFRVILDKDLNSSLGYRINEWEIRGVPLRLEIGGKEVQEKKIKMVRRDNFSKEMVKEEELVKSIKIILKEIQDNLLACSKKIKKDLTVDVDNYQDFKKYSKKKKFIRAFWCGDEKCEEKIKEETKLTTRVLEIGKQKNNSMGKCVYCGKKAKNKWIFAQSY